MASYFGIRTKVLLCSMVLLSLASCGGGGGGGDSSMGTVQGNISSSTVSATLVSYEAMLSGVTVSIGNQNAVTDSSGFYRIENLGPGLNTITASMFGYQDYTGSVTVVAGSTVTYDIAMTATFTGSPEVSVSSGCFDMGDNFGDGYQDERPVHRVCLSAYYIDKYEATQDDYKQLTGNTWPGKFPSCGWDCPVDDMFYQSDASDYCALAGKRLPTEAEWEYAARNRGLKQKYAGTNDLGALGNYAWYNANSEGSIHPVGQKLPNGLGIYDMSGNVNEWVSDWYAYYSPALVTNPQGALYNTPGPVRRGGSFRSSPTGLTTTNRYWVDYALGPSSRVYMPPEYIGIRCARSK